MLRMDDIGDKRPEPIRVPLSPLRDIFTPCVIKKLQDRRNPSQYLVFRLNVLLAHGPYPSDPLKASNLRCLRARKAAWETYLCAAFAKGMFEGDRGADLRSRLATPDDECFRSAMDECLTCWFLAGRMNLPVNPTAPGRQGKNLDMIIQLADGYIGVEVKSPFREVPKGARYGDDADKVSQAISSANEKFDDKGRNILVLVPSLTRSMFAERRDLVKAAYGQSKITSPVNMETGQAGPINTIFSADGKFLNRLKPNETYLKCNGLPAHMRVSAIVFIEEEVAYKHEQPNALRLLKEGLCGQCGRTWEKRCDLHFSQENEAWIKHNILVLHNPHAHHPLNMDMFNEFTQFVPKDGIMLWTDGYINNV